MKTEFAMLSYNLGALVSERDVGEKIEKTDVSMEDLPVVMRLVSWFFRERRVRLKSVLAIKERP
jgi:hypothetical protein